MELRTVTTMNSLAPFSIALSSGQSALAVRPEADCNPAELAMSLQLPFPVRLFMLSGGAGEMSSEATRRLNSLFQTVAAVLAETQTTVIDGGTQFGAMALLGKALAQAKQTASYIGVLPAHAETSPNGPEGQEVLEPHHSHFVLVESANWGEEVPLMYSLAGYLSRRSASVALLVNGGGISLKEVEWNVRQGREVIVIAGSGRLADEIAAAVGHPEAARASIAAVVRAGRLTVFDLLSEPLEKLAELLRQRLKSES